MYWFIDFLSKDNKPTAPTWKSLFTLFITVYAVAMLLTLMIEQLPFLQIEISLSFSKILIPLFLALSGCCAMYAGFQEKLDRFSLREFIVEQQMKSWKDWATQSVELKATSYLLPQMLTAEQIMSSEGAVRSNPTRSYKLTFLNARSVENSILQQALVALLTPMSQELKKQQGKMALFFLGSNSSLESVKQAIGQSFSALQLTQPKPEQVFCLERTFDMAFLQECLKQTKEKIGLLVCLNLSSENEYDEGTEMGVALLWQKVPTPLIKQSMFKSALFRPLITSKTDFSEAFRRIFLAKQVDIKELHNIWHLLKNGAEEGVMRQSIVQNGAVQSVGCYNLAHYMGTSSDMHKWLTIAFADEAYQKTGKPQMVAISTDSHAVLCQIGSGLPQEQHREISSSFHMPVFALLTIVFLLAAIGLFCDSLFSAERYHSAITITFIGVLFFLLLCIYKVIQFKNRLIGYQTSWLMEQEKRNAKLPYNNV